MTQKNTKYITALIVLVITITIFNIVWVYLNNITPYYDPAGHTNLAHIFATLFKGGISTNGIAGFLKISNYYPPFMYILGGIVSIFFGFDYKVLEYFSVLFPAVAAFFLYLYTARLTKSRLIGLFSAAFFILFPQIWEQSRYFMLDLPVTTFIIISLYFLEKSDNFEDKHSTFLFFLFASFAQLTKWYAGMYILVPFIYAIIKMMKVEKALRLKNLLPGILLAAFITLPWYVINFNQILIDVGLNSHPQYGAPTNLLSLGNFLYYTHSIFNYSIVSFQFVFLVASLILMAKSRFRYKYLLFTQVIFIYILFTFIGNKNYRYVIPLLPFLAIIMGYGAGNLIKNWRAKGVILLAGIFGASILMFFITSFDIPFKSDILSAQNILPDSSALYLLNLSSRDIPYKYETSAWSPKLVNDDLAGFTNSDAKILVNINSPYDSVAGLNLFSFPQNLNLHYSDAPEDQVEKINTNTKIREYINRFDFVLLPDQIVAPPGQVNYYNLDATRKYILAGKTRSFQLIKTYSLPNHDTLYLLKKNPIANQLVLNLSESDLSLVRDPAVANIYLQFMDDKLVWHQTYMKQHASQFIKKLDGVRAIRIDYPKAKLYISSMDGWRYDGDKQFDRNPVEHTTGH